MITKPTQSGRSLIMELIYLPLIRAFITWLTGLPLSG